MIYRTDNMDTKHIRIIPRLDIKGPHLVKGIHLEGLRVVGKPDEKAQEYYLCGADELLYMDIVASLYGRNNLLEIVRQTAKNIFIPLTVGGGIRSVEDIRSFLRAGADKVAINTAAVKNPNLIKEGAKLFGSQCLVVSIEAKRQKNGKWEVYTENGRERSNLDVFEWAHQVCDLGCGEILITSIDMEGTEKGYEYDLIHAIATAVSVPVIACGGAGSVDHVVDAVKCGVDAVSLASVLHYGKITIWDIKKRLYDEGIGVRFEG